MSHRTRTLEHLALAAVCCTLGFGLPAAAQTPGMSGPPDTPSPFGGMPSAEDQRPLSADEMKRYVAALEKLVDFGLDAEKKVDSRGAMSKAAEYQMAMQYSEEMHAVMKKNGFTPEAFSDVHGNAMMAFAALEMEKHRPEMDSARKQAMEQMKQMKAQLPPAQYEAMMKNMGHVMPMMDMYDNVPKQNVELMKKHRDQIQKIIDDARAKRKR